MATRDRPTLGVDHVTVVPTNFDRQGTAEDPSPEAAEELSRDGTDDDR